ncbi:hypothetical protein [Campylobacter hominis]|uniref:hypothetical protein n=1 Tax=Campylobacter hominis TaxID=76517 RepID=UPI00248CC94B|nr:hypothetical protein [Campylobacter hominis]
MKRIQKIEAKLPELKNKKRVSAYARVSVANGRTLNSLSQQISYYNKLITNNRDGNLLEFFQTLVFLEQVEIVKDFKKCLVLVRKEKST